MPVLQFPLCCSTSPDLSDVETFPGHSDKESSEAVEVLDWGVLEHNEEMNRETIRSDRAFLLVK